MKVTFRTRPEREITREIYNLRDFARAHAEAGGHFFDDGAMRFFNSRILWDSWAISGGVIYFVTSEQFDYNSPRLYSLRKGDLWNPRDTDTIGEFQQYETRAQAVYALRKITGGKRYEVKR